MLLSSFNAFVIYTILKYVFNLILNISMHHMASTNTHIPLSLPPSMYDQLTSYTRPDRSNQHHTKPTATHEIISKQHRLYPIPWNNIPTFYIQPPSPVLCRHTYPALRTWDPASTVRNTPGTCQLNTPVELARFDCQNHGPWTL